ncbi:SusC/RagA family TonB-linked outer membrane protein [Capnocytophaga catalasegens]|nr:TonB-dependent receptor [Capnocytophaga catalasegens]
MIKKSFFAPFWYQLILWSMFLHPFGVVFSKNTEGGKIYSYNYPNQQKTIEVKGIVSDEQGIPVAGANILVKGVAGKGTATDLEGNYKISVEEGAVLVFSSLGYQTTEVSVRGKKIINVVLKEEAEQLTGVVVTAFGGEQKKTSVVGSVQTVEVSDLKVPSSNLSASFAGRMAGVIAYQRTGQPGADGADFYIRGISTISGVRSPLIIVDGIEVSQGDLNAIDPEVIESFSVLKDATATALYGTRGANGVMIVTTKSGQNLEKPKINIRIETNVSQPTKIPKFVDGARYMRLYNEAVDNLSSGIIPYSQEQIMGTEQGLNPYVYPNVNWYKELFTNTSYARKINFNVRGGTKRVDYFLNASMNSESGMIRGLARNYGRSYDNNININRYNFHNNINARLTDITRITLRLNAQLNDRRQPNVKMDELFGFAMNTNPVDYPIIYPSDGVTLHDKWGAYYGLNTSAYNPVARLVSGYNDAFESTVIASLEFDQKLNFLLEGLKFNALASFKNYSSTENHRNAPYNTYSLERYNRNPDGTYTLYPKLNGTEVVPTLETTSYSGGDRKVYIQTALHYDATFAGIHALNAMFVYNQTDYNINNTHHKEAYNRMINALPKRKQGISARLSYAYDNRYLFEVNAGYNGSENFAKGNRFGFFPSIAVGYSISNEKFFEPLKNIVQDLKFRASWGLVGNDQIGSERFIYLPSINLQGRGYTTGLNQNYSLSGPVYNRFANYDLTWEVGEKINIGFNADLLKGLHITFDVFKEHRTNIFQQRYTIPNYLGTGNSKVFANSAAVENKGFDFDVSYEKQMNKDFWFSVKGTFTYARNKILKYDEPEGQDYPNLINVGSRLELWQGYLAEGFFIDQAEIDARSKQKISGNVAPGDIKYKDIPNKNGITDGQIDKNDQVWLGNPKTPEIVYGLGFNIKYKRWDCGVLFQGVANTSLMMQDFHPFGTNTRRNVLEWVADSHWSKENQNIYADYPRLTKDSHQNNTVNSSFWLRDASFLKLKNAEIGYTLNKLRIYMSGYNLLTFSKFKHWDPEMGSGSGLKYPTQRVFNLGVQLNIN